VSVSVCLVDMKDLKLNLPCTSNNFTPTSLRRIGFLTPLTDVVNGQEGLQNREVTAGDEIYQFMREQNVTSRDFIHIYATTQGYG